jgi:hypothetical protein
MAALTAIAAGCLNIAYHDTAPAAVLAGLALYLVGLDAVEPLAQEIDQADRADSIPKERGVLLVRHLPASALLLFLYAIFGGAVAYAFNRTGTALAIIAVVSLPAMWAAGAAVISVAGESRPVRPTPTRCSLPRCWHRIMFRTAARRGCILGTVPVSAQRGSRPGPPPGRSRQHGRAVVVGLRTGRPHSRRRVWRSMMRRASRAGPPPPPGRTMSSAASDGPSHEQQ